MNFLGHLRVALGVSDEPLVLLGAILPDVESLLGPVLAHGREDPDIRRGITIHHRTDAVFHADRRFTTGSIALTRALQARDVGRGASRGIGHAGWELLLDGVLSDDEATTEAFTVAVAALEERAEPERFAPFAVRQRATPIWVGYRDPAEVAARLHRQLAARPRLAFPLDDLPAVAAELRSAQAGIAEIGTALATDVGRAVTAAREPRR